MTKIPSSCIKCQCSVCSAPQIAAKAPRRDGYHVPTQGENVTPQLGQERRKTVRITQAAMSGKLGTGPK